MPIDRASVLVSRDGDGFVAVHRELDVASQGPTVAEALANLEDAVALFLECADPSEVERRRGNPPRTIEPS